MEAIGTLAGGIAHDFNNVLFSILGNAELVKEDIAADSEAAQCVDEILKASYRARDLIRQILSFSRGDLQERVPVYVQDIVVEAVSMLRASLPPTIEIDTHLSPKCNAMLAEPTQIHQVVMNLCTNAAQAMELQGGQLDISLDEIDVETAEAREMSPWTTGRYVQLTVSDTGQGIDPQIIERIFDPYFTTKPMGKGSGMGLAMVHGIVTNNDGTITVENEPGSGAVFRIRFPVNSLEDIKTPSANVVTMYGEERILFVDDEPSLIRLNRKQLKRLGYDVTAVSSSLDALDLFRADPEAFDLIVTDQTMPNLSGDQLAAAMLAIRPDLPVILCTGYSENVDDRTILANGISALVMKPIKRDELVSVIREVLDKHPSMPCA